MAQSMQFSPREEPCLGKSAATASCLEGLAVDSFYSLFCSFPQKKIQTKKHKKKGKISPTALCVLQCGKLNRAEKNTRGHRLRKDPWTAAAQLMTTVSCTAWPLYICGSRWMNLEMEEKKKASCKAFFFFFLHLLERKKISILKRMNLEAEMNLWSEIQNICRLLNPT